MYLWLVFAHLLGFVLFLVGHGVSIACAFRLRRERERPRLVLLLGLSSTWNQVAQLGLIVLAIAGLGAAWSANQLTAPWIVASYVVLIAVMVAMYAIAAPFYYGLRDAAAGAKGAPPIDEAELVRRLANRRPDALAAIGGIGLLLLVWLMVLKPG